MSKNKKPIFSRSNPVADLLGGLTRPQDQAAAIEALLGQAKAPVIVCLAIVDTRLPPSDIRLLWAGAQVIPGSVIAAVRDRLSDVLAEAKAQALLQQQQPPPQGTPVEQTSPPPPPDGQPGG